MSEDTERTALPPPMALYQLAIGHYASRALHLAAKLGVADRLADGPRTADELAAATETHTRSLRRVLRFLASLRVLEEREDGRFALTPLGDALRADVPGSARAMVMLFSGIGIQDSWKELEWCVRTGEPAYRLPDIAYHVDKLRRAFDLVVDVLGADHIAEHEEVAAALRALGQDATRVRPVIYQFVTLTRHGEQVKMSTRRAEYVTLDELLDEVGVDAARFFFLMRKSDSHLEFDLDLAKQQSTENPVFYVQYAHARIASVFRQAAQAGIEPAPAPDLGPLGEPEVETLRVLAGWPDVVEAAARDLEPHRVAFFALELAGAFHRYYNRHRILTEDPALTQARLALVRAVQQVLRGALGVAGVAAPERM